MRFEWNQAKNRLNRKKHGVSFEVAQEVFADPFCLTIHDQTIEGGDRYWTIGRVAKLVILVVVHTVTDQEGEEVIRIISARKATPRERTFYEEVDK